MQAPARSIFSRFSFNASLATASTAVILLSACASTGAPADASLPRYEQLTVQADGVRGYRSPRAAQYRNADIDPADIVIAATSLSEAQTRELRSTLTAALASHLQKAGLRHPGNTPSLRVRATVTAVTTANPILNTVSTVILLAPVSRGGLTLEIEAVDAVSGDRVAAIAYEGKAGVSDALNAFSSMGHVALVADRASRRFTTLVAGTEVHASSSSTGR